MANGGLHQCFCDDGKTVACICVRGQDHDEILFDVAVGDELEVEDLPDEVDPNETSGAGKGPERLAEDKGITTTTED